MNKCFTDEYNNYNLLGYTLNDDYRLYYDLLGYKLNTDYKRCIELWIHCIIIC